MTLFWALLSINSKNVKKQHFFGLKPVLNCPIRVQLCQNSFFWPNFTYFTLWVAWSWMFQSKNALKHPKTGLKGPFWAKMTLSETIKDFPGPKNGFPGLSWDFPGLSWTFLDQKMAIHSKIGFFSEENYQERLVLVKTCLFWDQWGLSGPKKDI